MPSTHDDSKIADKKLLEKFKYNFEKYTSTHIENA